MLRAAGGGGGGGAVAVGDISGLGTNVATALAVNIGSAGAPVVLNGAGGTPSSLTGTNITGIPPAGVTGTAAILGANTFPALQTITQASANAGILASTGYSLTGSNATSMIDLAGTWNTSGNPKGFVIAITRTAVGTNATAKYFEVLGGSTGAKTLLNVDAGGVTNINTDAAISSTVLRLGDSNGNVNWTFSGSGSGTGILTGPASGISQISANEYRFTTSAGDTIVSRGGVATLQQGAANSATPVAQVLQAQGSRAGSDTNVAGASYTIRPGAGTGNATPGALILQSYVAGASGTGAQTATTSITVSNGGATIGVGGLTFPTADPLIAGRWWDNAGTLTKSAG